MLSGFLGENRNIFFPKLDDKLHLITFSEIANQFLRQKGYEPYECESEEEARGRVDDLIPIRKWPVYFFDSDTTGEKDVEEFFTSAEILDMERYKSVGVIENQPIFDEKRLEKFSHGFKAMQANGVWDKHEILALFRDILPEFAHS